MEWLNFLIEKISSSNIFWTLLGVFLGILGSIIANYYTPRVLYRWEKVIKKKWGRNEPIFEQSNNVYSSICSYDIDEKKFSEIVEGYINNDTNKTINEAIISNIQMPQWFVNKLKNDGIFTTHILAIEKLAQEEKLDICKIKQNLNNIKDEFYKNTHNAFLHQKSMYNRNLKTTRYNLYKIDFNFDGKPINNSDLIEFKKYNNLASVLIFEKIFGDNDIFRNYILCPNHVKIKPNSSCELKGTDAIILLKRKVLKRPFVKTKTVLYYDDEIYMLNYQTINKTDTLKNGFFQRILKFKENEEIADYKLHSFKDILTAYSLSLKQIDNLMK